eukprot:3293334-Pleurochrysis_carterae.AAC.2
MGHTCADCFSDKHCRHADFQQAGRRTGMLVQMKQRREKCQRQGGRGGGWSYKTVGWAITNLARLSWSSR